MANFKHTACSSPDCSLPHTARGFCQKHYDIFRRPRVGRFIETDLERFWRQVDKSGGCWLWSGSLLSNGYGQFHLRRDTQKMVKSHRFAYTVVKGEIPAGLTLDHLCKVRRCVNPDHLEAVTQGVNTLRGDGPSAKNKRKTHCHRGHELTGANLVLSPGHRRCRTCRALMPSRDNAFRRKKYQDSLQTRRESGQHG